MESDVLRERAIDSLVRERRSGSVSGAFVVISLVLVVVWGATGAGYFWPVWPILAGLVAFAAVSLAANWSNRTFAETTVRVRMAEITGKAPPGIQR